MNLVLAPSKQDHWNAKLSVITITLTGILTSLHHLYRFGFEVIVPAGIVIALPYLLMRWFWRGGRWLAFAAYGIFSALIILWFGISDGFLDHTVKLFGGTPIHFLPESPIVGDLLYETTGILSFVASMFAAYYLYKFIRDTLRVGLPDKS